ncbi:MAG: SgcJ/EcaC family oxidoreductase [Sphingomicrobium sp.]|nr:SgcJ/EcaC family oxidoreductase [Sphingomonadales bacterium]
MITTGKTKLLMAVVLAAFAASCDKSERGKATTGDGANVKQAIATIEAGWNQAFHTKNLDALVTPYASDAVFVLPGAPAQVGTSAIRGVYAAALKDPNFDVTLTSDRLEVAQSGDLALSQGHLTMKGTDPKTKQPTTTMTGPYVTVFKKQADGSWKAIQDWVAANPPKAPAK